MNDNIKAGADLHAGDGGYSEGTQEKYNEFVKGRNQFSGKARIQELMIQADYPAPELALRAHRLAELIIKECIGILETEIELVKGYKSTACNDFDVRWHEGKIEHFTKLIEKSKKHFGVEE